MARTPLQPFAMKQSGKFATISYVYYSRDNEHMSLTDFIELGLAYSQVTTKSCFKKENWLRYVEEEGVLNWFHAVPDLLNFLEDGDFEPLQGESEGNRQTLSRSPSKCSRYFK